MNHEILIVLVPAPVGLEGKVVRPRCLAGMGRRQAHPDPARKFGGIGISTQALPRSLDHLGDLEIAGDDGACRPQYHNLLTLDGMRHPVAHPHADVVPVALRGRNDWPVDPEDRPLGPDVTSICAPRDVKASHRREEGQHGNNVGARPVHLVDLNHLPSPPTSPDTEHAEVGS